jgi:hypothetical protein
MSSGPLTWTSWAPQQLNGRVWRRLEPRCCPAGRDLHLPIRVSIYNFHIQPGVVLKLVLGVGFEPPASSGGGEISDCQELSGCI